MVAQICKYAKNYWTVHLNQINFMVFNYVSKNLSIKK